MFQSLEMTVASLHQPWSLDIISCAAPIAYLVGQSRACSLLQRRVYRILDVARAHSYQTLVIGAWGCGNFETNLFMWPKPSFMRLKGNLQVASRRLFLLSQTGLHKDACLDRLLEFSNQEQGGYKYSL